MRLHFAAERVLQRVSQLRPGIECIGAHVSPEKARTVAVRGFDLGAKPRLVIASGCEARPSQLIAIASASPFPCRIPCPLPVTFPLREIQAAVGEKNLARQVIRRNKH